MKTKMCFSSILSVFTILVATTIFTGCKSCTNPLDPALKNVVVFHYDHVANVNEIRFQNNLDLPGSFGIGSVSPARGGFWAVFVICSLDVQGKEIQTFEYNTSNFYVEYEDKNYFQPLLPFTVRFASSTSMNDASNTAKVSDAIVNEVQLGPASQTFPRQFYPALNYRIAILIPDALPTYRGEQLTLRYSGKPSILIGGGNKPKTINVMGVNFEEPLGICRPPIQQ